MNFATTRPCIPFSIASLGYFTVCIMLIVLLFITTILMAVSPAITMCALSNYEKAPRSEMPSDIYDE